MNTLTFPDKFAKVIDADHHQKVILKFAVTDKGTKERMKVHQVKSSKTLTGSKAETN